MTDLAGLDRWKLATITIINVPHGRHQSPFDAFFCDFICLNFALFIILWNDENCFDCAVDSSESTNIVFFNTINYRIICFVKWICMKWCVRLDVNWFSCDLLFLIYLHVLVWFKWHNTTLNLIIFENAMWEVWLCHGTITIIGTCEKQSQQL